MDMAAGSQALFLGQGVSNYVFLGEAGCGKSEIAINLALALAAEEAPVHFFDLDMTKPLFRSRNQAGLLTGQGVEVHFEEQFMDAPTTVGGVRQALQNSSCTAVLDVGGDSIGARSIGGYAPLLNRPDTAVFYVMNPYRPWSTTLERIDKVLGETLGVSHIALPHLRLIGNPNLGRDTTPADVLQGAKTLEALVGDYKPVELFCVWEELYDQVRAKLDRPLVPLKLFLTYPWETTA